MGRAQREAGRRSRAVMVGCLLWLSAGCRPEQPGRVDFSDSPRNFLPGDYPAVYARWTRHAMVVSERGTLIEVWATLKSAEFREAYIERYVDMYRLSAAERNELRRLQLVEARRELEFHLQVQTSKIEWNDLERRQSPWRISLTDGAEEKLEGPTVAVPRFPELFEQVFFPRRTPFTRTYVVTFALPEEAEGGGFAGPQSGQVTLRVTGPQGEAELTWLAL